MFAWRLCPCVMVDDERAHVDAADMDATASHKHFAGGESGQGRCCALPVPRSGTAGPLFLEHLGGELLGDLRCFCADAAPLLCLNSPHHLVHSRCNPADHIGEQVNAAT